MNLQANIINDNIDSRIQDLVLISNLFLSIEVACLNIASSVKLSTSTTINILHLGTLFST